MSKNNTSSAFAETDEQIMACFDAMAELRPHLTRAAFLERIRRQMASGYRLAYTCESGAVVACAGFRILETLAWGRILYVDDLVTIERRRSAGFGARMMEWLTEHARRAKCDEFHLDSGTWRTDAHRFYFKHGMVIKSFHFSRQPP
jgi:GNAT superfamily N-acetyltransferase